MELSGAPDSGPDPRFSALKNLCVSKGPPGPPLDPPGPPPDHVPPVPFKPIFRNISPQRTSHRL